MKRGLVAGIVLTFMMVAQTPVGIAMPTIVSTPNAHVASSSIIEARLFCYNRYTGRFKHWGACNSAPRVYCRSRSTGEFLHWGACGY